MKQQVQGRAEEAGDILGVAAMMSVSCQRRALVRRKPTGLELLYHLYAAAGSKAAAEGS